MTWSLIQGLILARLYIESILNKKKVVIDAGFPGSSTGKVFPCNAGDPGLIPGSWSFPGEGIDYSLQYSCASLVAQMINNPPAIWET